MITRFTAVLLAILGCVVFTNYAIADTFGSGANTFDIEFVDIGNPGNLADNTGNPNPGAGSVPYSYRIGKYEISEEMIEKANSEGGLGITKDARSANKPATNVSWLEAAKFVNWLNTNTGNTPAYKLSGTGALQLWVPGDAGYDPTNLYRNSLAKYFLPSVHEWYKAAYFDPVAAVYYDYATGSNSLPDGTDFPGDTLFEIVFPNPGYNNQPNDITDVGVLSPYGTAGQGGNVWELNETESDLVNDLNGSGAPYSNILRGGGWENIFCACFDAGASTGNVFSIFPSNSDSVVGFRVASVVPIPEPGTLLLGMVAGVVCPLPRGRRA